MIVILTFNFWYFYFWLVRRIRHYIWSILCRVWRTSLSFIVHFMIKLGDFVIFVSLNFDIFTWKASHITAIASI